jgi:hypothetical protein
LIFGFIYILQRFQLGNYFGASRHARVLSPLAYPAMKGNEIMEHTYDLRHRKDWNRTKSGLGFSKLFVIFASDKLFVS